MAPYFKYIAENNEGEAIEKIVKSDTPIEIARKLRKKGYHIIEINKTDKVKLKKRKINIKLKKYKLPKAELLIFSEQFSIMIKSGLSIVESLEIIEEESNNQYFKNSINEIRQEIEKGSSLSETIAKKDNIFPDFYQQMIKIGEITGNLSLILKDLSLYYKWQLDLYKKTKNILYYPFLLLVAALLSIIILLNFVIPSFVEIFESYNTSLPYSTKVVLFFSQFSQKYFLYFLLFLFLLMIILKFYIKTDKGKEEFDRSILKLPYLGKIKKYILIWRFSDMLNLLLKNGISLLDSLAIIEKTIKNKVLKNIIYNAQIEIREGKEFSTTIIKSNFFPIIITKLIKTGEKTGQLETMLKEISKYFHNKVEQKMNNFVTLLEPVLIIFIAFIIGFIAISVIMPMFNMYSVF